MFLTTENLTKDFGDVQAVLDVNLEIDRGEFVSIMGPSGSGKTTLLTLLGALDTPSSGEVFIEGEPLSGIKDVDLFRSKKVGFVFQFHNLISYLNALENVEIPMHGPMSGTERRARAIELLELVGLGERVYHNPSQLSGGERQRVAVARALVNDPALVLADEPTGELDSKTSIEIIQLMKKINKEKGTTFIVVTHDPEVAKKAEKIIFLKNGTIARQEAVKSESVEDVLALRNSAFGQQLIEKKATDPYMENLGVFKGGTLTKEGEAVLSVLEKAEAIERD
ncbi:MAG: ABC transporter ATP-binding protein [Theionarchaea archaeon]|nr:ABC transporter ATP-binding protein [Theionarchaea archaeon]MBU7038645.1 ABC transporter ATP-binding protein [Theionarchaea archaeon]